MMPALAKLKRARVVRVHPSSAYLSLSSRVYAHQITFCFDNDILTHNLPDGVTPSDVVKASRSIETWPFTSSLRLELTPWGHYEFRPGGPLVLPGGFRVIPQEQVWFYPVLCPIGLPKFRANCKLFLHAPGKSYIPLTVVSYHLYVPEPFDLPVALNAFLPNGLVDLVEHYVWPFEGKLINKHK